MGRCLMVKVLGVLGAILLGVLANDIWALSAPLARRTVVLAARLWARDQEQAEILAEEWRAYIDDRPGQVLKLLTATAFLLAAVGRLVGRRFTARSRRIKPAIGASPGIRFLDVKVGEADAVLVGLLVGLLSSLAPLLFYLIGLDTSWALLGWGVGITVASAAAASSITFGFLVRRPPSLPRDATSLAALAHIVAAPPDEAEPPSPMHSALLVRPFVQRTWQRRRSQPEQTGLVRPYVKSADNPNSTQ
jgi:hypothetical protein